MSDISLSSQQILTQALAQLTQAQNTSPIAKQAAQVIIQHLAGNQITINIPKQQQSIQLPKPEKLPAGLIGMPVEAQLSSVLDKSGKRAVQGTLALFDGNITDHNTGKHKATLLSKLNQAQINTILEAIGSKAAPEPSAKAQIINAKIVAISSNTITVAAQINGREQTIKLNVPELPQAIKVAQTVQIQVVARGADWQVSLLKGSQTNSVVKGHSSLESPVIIDKQQIVKLLQSESARTSPTNQPASLQIPKQALVELLTRQPQLLSTAALEKLATLPASVTKVSLTLNKNLHGELKATVQMPALTIKLTGEQTKQLQTLLGNNSNLDAGKVISEQKESLAVSHNTRSNKTEVSSSPTQSDVRPTASTENKSDIGLSKGRINVAEIPPMQKQQLVQQINDVIRRLLPQSASPSETLLQIEKSLLDTSVIKDPTTKVILEQLVKQIQHSTVQGKEADANHIKQLMSQAAVPLTSAQIVQPANQQQGLMGGLITLLQVALSARLVKAQPQSNERVSQIITTLLGVSVKPTVTQTQRSMNDVNQLEQKHQILKQLGRLFTQHQTSKLVSAEQTLQGQEALYYVLPSGTGENKRDIELLIKREPDSGSQQTKKTKASGIWHLTMKLDVGEMGQILTKARLHDTRLELDLYTSNEQIKELVFNYLPLFKRRLETLGIEVAKTQCQLGKIPEQLQARPYQIFETKA